MMFNRVLTTCGAIALAGCLAGGAQADLLGYWDLNTASQDMANGTVFNADQGAGTITLGTNGDRWDAEAGNSVNLLAPSVAGEALRVTGGQASNGASFDIAIDATEFEDLILTFALDIDNSNGPDANQLSYSSNGGGAFTNFGGVFPGGTTSGPELQTFDLSAVDALDDNADVVLRITIGGASGGNFTRDSVWDNFQVNANFIPEPASLMLLAAGSGIAMARRGRGGKRQS